MEKKYSKLFQKTLSILITSLTLSSFSPLFPTPTNIQQTDEFERFLQNLKDMPYSPSLKQRFHSLLQWAKEHKKKLIAGSACLLTLLLLLKKCWTTTEGKQNTNTTSDNQRSKQSTKKHNNNKVNAITVSLEEDSRTLDVPQDVMKLSKTYTTMRDDLGQADQTFPLPSEISFDSFSFLVTHVQNYLQNKEKALESLLKAKLPVRQCIQMLNTANYLDMPQELLDNLALCAGMANQQTMLSSDEYKSLVPAEIRALIDKHYYQAVRQNTPEALFPIILTPHETFCHLNDARFSPRNTTMLTISPRKKTLLIKGLDEDTQKSIKLPTACKKAFFSNDENYVIALLANSTIVITDITSMKQVTLPTQGSDIRNVQCAENAHRILTHTLQKHTQSRTHLNHIQLWDFDGNELFSLDDLKGIIQAISLNPQASHLLITKSNGDLLLYNLNNAEHKKLFHRRVSSAHFNNQGNRILSVSWRRGDAILWDSNGTKLNDFSDEKLALALFEQDGESVLGITQYGMIVTIDEKEIIEIGRFDKRDDHLTACNETRSTILSGSINGKAQIVTRDGKPIATLDHDKPITRLHFSSDSKHIFTGSYQGKIVLWDANGEKLATFEHPHLTNLITSPRGTHFFTKSGQETKIWKLPLNYLNGKLRLEQTTLLAFLYKQKQEGKPTVLTKEQQNVLESFEQPVQKSLITKYNLNAKQG